MATVGWFDSESTALAYTRRAWPDSKTITDARLVELLNVGFEACVQYAPALDADAAIPTRYREAQVLAARAVHTAARATGGDLGLADDGAVTLPTPVLSVQVLTLLRPPAGPVIA